MSESCRTPHAWCPPGRDPSTASPVPVGPDEPIVLASPLSLRTRLALRAAHRRDHLQWLAPADLLHRRGLSRVELGRDAVYADELLGIIIAPPDWAARIESTLASLGLSVRRAGSHSIGAAASARMPAQAALQPLWYVERLGGWPRWTGRGQRVALIDTGITPAHPLLPRWADLRDDASTRHPRGSPVDVRGHGTACAGIIAGRMHPELGRYSVAPEALLGVGRMATQGGEVGMASFDFLLMLAWAVHAWRARVVAFPYAYESIRVGGRADVDLYSWVAQRLRRADRCLLFAAAGNEAGPPGLPAASPGVIGIGAYQAWPAAPARVVPICAYGGVQQPSPHAEFFLAPGHSMRTTEPAADMLEDFSGTSAACAFAAGIAALYLERFEKDRLRLGRGYHLGEVLSAMRRDAETLVHPCFPGRHWLGLRFPA